MRCLKMSENELQKNEILLLLLQGKLQRAEAAERLKITLRQVDRLKNRFKAEGIKGLVHRNRGKASNRKLCEEIIVKVLSIVKENYNGFGPTLAAEKLLEQYQLNISRETLRILMHREGLWKGKKRKPKKYHPRRARREHLGELLQGDGSHHYWFEERGDQCVLIAFIDDATNRAYGRFYPAETTEGYAETMKRYIKKYGKPLNFYVDRDSIFRVNRAHLSEAARGETEFARMMRELSIHLICARSPQAKGRIERLFGTLQDRLVKEMRLLKLSSIEEGNAYLENQFWDEYNKKWNCEAAKPEDKHGQVPADHILERVFTLREERKISKSLDFSYKGITYQVKTSTPRRVANTKIVIFQKFDGTFWVESNREKLDVCLLKESTRSVPIEDAKTINAFLNKKPRLSAITRKRKGIACPS